MRGRRKINYLPYEDAVEYIRKKGFKNRKDYTQWWQRTQPSYVPCKPNRVYEEWESWNTWLGTNNSFEKTWHRKVENYVPPLPFWEAVRHAQALAKQYNLKTAKQWAAWYKENEDKVPRGVPRWPHMAYPEFIGTGWKTWLGKDVKRVVETAQHDVSVFAVCRVMGEPPNVITCVIDRGGSSSLMTRVNNGELGRPYRVYNWEEQLKNSVDYALNAFANRRDSNVFIVPNINQLLFELDMLLEFAIPPRELGVG